jgi:hypothetical protein
MSKVETVETFFLITVNEDGTLTSYAEMPETMPEAKRPATNFDVFNTSKQIVDEFEQSLLANKVANAVLAALQPQAQSVPESVKDKLKERGINPEGAVSAE